MRRPDFIGIGMSKCGTSWLDRVLREHPSVAMPPVKELHFFDDYYQLILRGDRSRYFSADRYSKRRWRRYLRSQVRRAVRYPSIGNIVWTARFLAGRRDFGWYGNLFDEGGERVRGEITPDYAVLERGPIAEIGARLPELKVILLLRDPVERLWSHAKMELGSRKKRRMADVSLEEMRSFLLEDEGVGRRVEYRRIVTDWSSVFSGRFFVGLFDDIVAEPESLVERVCDFLGVPSPQLPDPLYRSVVYKGPSDSLPRSLRAELVERYAPEADFVAEYLGRDLGSRWALPPG